VFTSNTNTARNFDVSVKRTGIAKVDPAGRKLLLHSFRHTYATVMAWQVQNNPHFLKSILGHGKITTTDRYCQVEPKVVPISGLNLSLAMKHERPVKSPPARIVSHTKTA
jgi:site-specific recombinase XerD